MKRLNEYSFIIEILLACAMTCSVMLGYSEFASTIFAINFVMIVVLFFFTFGVGVQQNRVRILIALLLMVASFSWICAERQRLDFAYMKKWIIFICTMIFYYCINESTITKRIINTFFVSGIIITIAFAVMYFTGNTQNLGKYITFGLGNPNFTGMCLLCTFLCMAAMLDFIKRRFRRFLIFISLIFLAYLIYLTEARSCIIAMVLWLGMKLFYQKKYSSKMSFWVLMFPLIFAIVYMQVVDNPAVREFFSFAVSEGKSISSRQKIWSRAVDIFRDNILFGSYLRATDGRGMGQLHNIHLDTLAAYGIMTFTAMIYFLQSILNSIGKQITERYQLMAMIGFYAVIISGTFEAGLFSGSQGMYVLSGGLLMLAKYNRQHSVPVDDVMEN